MALDRASQIQTDIKDFAPNLHEVVFAWARFDFYELASEENLRSDSPFLCRGPSRELCQLPLQPSLVAFGEATSFSNRATAGDTHSCRSVRAQSEHIPARARITDESNRD